MTRPLFSWDLESFLISPGCQAPPSVSLQFCLDDSGPQLIHARDPAWRRWLVYAYENALMSAHGGAFDHCVVMAAYPDLIPLVFDAFDADRVVCTIVRQKLLEIATGRYKALAKGRGTYTLDAVAERLHASGVAERVHVDKNDPWRLRYGTLYKLPVAQWPEDAKQYALTDARVQRIVHRGQDAYAALKAQDFRCTFAGPSLPAAPRSLTGAELLRDQFAQSRAALWLRLLECRGIMVDPVRVEEYIDNTKAQLAKDQAICIAEGLVRGPVKPTNYKGSWEPYSRDMKAGALRMVEVCKLAEERDLPITATGERVLRAELKLDEKAFIPPGASWGLWERHRKYVKLDEEACEVYGDEVLEAFQRCGTAATQIARAERLRHGTRTPIQASFQSLIDTGRTACRQGDVKPGESPAAWGAQLQNPAKDKKRKRDGVDVIVKGTRECYVPRPRYLFCSTDYESMELCGVSQVCIWLFGHSKLADVINEGRDAHTELGATLIEIPTTEAYARRAGQRGEDLKKHFNGQVRQTGKVGNFGFWGGMGPAKIVFAARKQYGVKLGAKDPKQERVPWDDALEAAKKLKRAWLATWPEAEEYFAWINRKLDHEGYGPEKNRRVDIRQFVSGRVRGNCYYTHAANTTFQGLCADIAKDAAWHIAREMYCVPKSPLYGSRLVNFLHDEMFSELLADRAHEAAIRQAEIQVEVAKKWAPNLKWACTPALMNRWYKDAEAVYQTPDGEPHKKPVANSRLVAWTPEIAAYWEAKSKAEQERQAA